MNDFTIDLHDLKQLERFFRDSPKLLKPVTANVLTSLAFDNRKLNIRNIESSMIIRNRKFVESSLQVQKARSGSIDSQIALSGSVNRPRFTGWEEQQEGKPSHTKRIITTAGRGGNRKNVAISKARLKPSNKFYKPSQFAGRDNKSRFMFMMRVLNSRNGGEFIIDNDMATKRSILRKGLYQLKSHRIKLLQQFNSNKSTHIPWATKSIQQQKFNTNIMQKYRDGVKHIVAKYNK
jgi:hypothetical protein